MIARQRFTTAKNSLYSDAPPSANEGNAGSKLAAMTFQGGALTTEGWHAGGLRDVVDAGVGCEVLPLGEPPYAIHVSLLLDVYSRKQGFGDRCRVRSPARRHAMFISHTVFMKSFSRSQLPHKSVNLLFTITH